jgi:GT2 family glycosyltransferase
MKTFVSAIVISHDSPEFLSRTLEALKNQPINELVHVETSNNISAGSLSLPGATLAKSLDFAVQQTSAESQWLWILHEDSTPLSGALQQQLAVAEVSPSVAVIGAKQVDYQDHRTIVQLGLTLTKQKKLFSLVSGELDQSQYDAMSDVLAVGTAGMLVKKSIWLELGGLADRMPPLAADIDFSMRARAASHRVVVAPHAKVAHAALSINGKRAKRWLGAAPKTAFRRAELQLRLSWSPLWVAVAFWLALPVITLSRIVWRVWAKRPDRIVGEIAAALWATFTVFARFSTRRRTTRAIRAGFAALSATKQQVRDDRRRNLEQDEIDARLEAHAALAERGQGDDATPNTEQILLSSVSSAKSFVQARGLWFIAALFAFSFSFWPRSVAINDGAVIALNQNWFDLFRRAGASWHPIAEGFFAPSDPFVWVLTLLGSLTFWQPSLAISLFVFASLPIAFYGAYKATAVFTTKTHLRNISALIYVLWPSVLIAQSELRIASLVAQVALPYLLFTVARVALLGREISVRSRQQTFTWVGLSGLLLAIVSAAAPNTMVISAIALITVFIIRPRRIGYLIWVALPTAAIFAPLSVYLAVLRGQPLAILADPGVPLDTVSVAAWQFISGALVEQLTLPTLITIVSSGLVVFLAALGLLSRRFAVVVSLLGFGLIALAAAWAIAQIDFVASGVGLTTTQFVSGSPHALLAIWGLSLALAIAAWLDTVKRRQASRVLATALIALVVMPSAVGAVLSKPQVSFSSDRVMPALIDAQANSGLQAKVLVVSPAVDSAEYSATLVEADGVQLEDLSVAYRFALAEIVAEQANYRVVAQLVADLVAANGAAIDSPLQSNSIAYVMIPKANNQTESNANAKLAVAFDSIAQLESAGQTDFGQIWRVRNAQSTAEKTEESPWSVTKAIQLTILISFMLLAIPSAGRRRAAASSEIFVDGGESND